jgi:hypothetical protein
MALVMGLDPSQALAGVILGVKYESETDHTTDLFHFLILCQGPNCASPMPPQSGPFHEVPFI